MAVLPVSRMGAEVLKCRAEAVANPRDPAIAELANDMIETMMAVRGIGLAAPQVGQSKRMVVFFVPAGRNADIEVPLTVMINPEVTVLGRAQDEQYEACLSVPGLTGKVPRYTRIRYAFQDLSGTRIEREAEAFHARVVQHECDHLDGVLYPMRMTDMTTLAFADVLHAEATAKGQAIDLDEEEILAE